MLNYFTYLRLKRFGVAEDAVNYTEHDRRYHKGHFDPATMTCEMREAESQGDLVDVLNAEEGEKALYWKKYWKEHPEELAAKRERAEAARKSRREEKRRKAEAERKAKGDDVNRKTVDELLARSFTESDRKMVDDALAFALNSPPAEVEKEEAEETRKKVQAEKKYEEGLVNLINSRFPKGISSPLLGDIEVGNRAAHSLFAHKGGGFSLPTAAIFAKLDALLAMAKPFAVSSHWKGRPHTSIGLCAPMRLNGGDFIAEFIVTQNTIGRNRLYAVSWVKRNEVEGGFHLVAATKGGRGASPPSTTANSVPKTGGGVNRDITENSGAAKLPRSNLVRQYLAAHGLLGQYVTQ